MKVREIMSSLDASVSPDSPVSEVARLLIERHLSGIPVVKGNKLAGLITQRDVVTKHAHVHLPVFIGLIGYVAPFELPGSRDEVERALAVTAGQLMDTDPVTADVGDDVDDVATLMVDKDVDPIPVMDDGVLVGTISMADIIRLVLVEEGDGSGG